MSFFYEKAATALMIKHGMSVVHQAVDYLNPGQICVIAVDQPLYALAKKVFTGNGRTRTGRTNLSSC